jgi:hypothetical protein
MGVLAVLARRFGFAFLFGLTIGWPATTMAAATDEALDDLLIGLEEIRAEIEAAEADRARFEGGVVLALIEARLATLKLTQALLEQRAMAEREGVDVKFVLPVNEPNPERAAEILLEIGDAEKELRDIEAEARGTGGMVGAMAMLAVSTQKQTITMLRLAYYANMYGLGVIHVPEDARGGASASPGDQGATQEAVDSVRQCLQEKVTISEASIDKLAEDIWTHRIGAAVTNRLDWPIAGIHLAYQVFSEGRSVPWTKSDTSLAIGGGTEPGETKKIGWSIDVPTDAPDQLIAHVQVLDVLDQYERQLIGDEHVRMWDTQGPLPSLIVEGKEKSDMRCDPAGGK